MENLTRLILRSYVISYPVILSWGLAYAKPIALVFDDGLDVQDYIRGLGLDSKILNSTVPVEKCIKDLGAANSDAVFLIVNLDDMKRCTDKMRKRIDLIASAAQLRCAGDVKSGCACFYCFYGFIPPEFEKDVFVIRLKGALPNHSDENILQFVPESQQLEVVREKLRESFAMEAREKWLYAACAFMYPKIVDTDMLPLYGELLEAIPRLLETDEAYHDRDAVIDLAVDHLCDLTVQGKFDDAWNLSAGPIDGDLNQEWIESQFFYRDHYLYMSEKRFRELFAPILEAVPIDLLKERLVTEGIIVGDGHRFTAKVFIRLKSESPIRIRLVRFDMSRLATEDGAVLDDFIRYSGGRN